MDTFSAAAADFGFASGPAGYSFSAYQGDSGSGHEGAGGLLPEGAVQAPWMDSAGTLLSPGQSSSESSYGGEPFPGASSAYTGLGNLSGSPVSLTPSGLAGYVPGSLLRRYA